MKVLRVPSAAAVQSILQEYGLMRGMRDCPNVVRIDETAAVPAGDGGGMVFVRMELLQPLQEVAAAQKLSEREIVRIGTDICRALQVCEQRNILHGGIKPQNILRAPDGTWKLGDCGISRAMERITYRANSFTRQYLAPEAARGNHYDHTSDLYALGLVLYCLCNNLRLPFLPLYGPVSADALEEALGRRFSGERIPEPATGSRELVRVVLRACSAERGSRFGSAREMLTALRAGGPVQVPVRPAGEEPKRAGLPGFVLPLIVVLAVVAGIGVGIFLMGGSLPWAKDSGSSSAENQAEATVPDGESDPDDTEKESSEETEESSDEDDSSEGLTFGEDEDDEDESDEEEVNGTSPSGHEAVDGQIFPDSSTSYLSQSDVESLNAQETQDAINELFARNGYSFKEEKYRDFYGRQDWYQPSEADMSVVEQRIRSNDVERANLELLTQHRDELK